MNNTENEHELYGIAKEQKEKVADAINDIGLWLIKNTFKDEFPLKVFELLEDSLYSKTVIEAIEKDIGRQLKKSGTNINDCESYGNDMIYNPINDVFEKDMNAEEFQEYRKVTEGRKK